MRTPPNVPPPPATKRPDGRFNAQTRRYRLITPLFGGGVIPAEADPVTVIRGPEIRGHLRFWWRACHGGRYNGDLRAMKEAEDRLWGASSTEAKPRPSKVQVTVEVINRGKRFVVRTGKGEQVHISAPKSPYGYAAFPLTNKPGAVVLEGVEFSVTITFPEAEQKEVEATLWAWETFGGLGARTRRGFGALCRTHVDGNPASLPQAARAEALIRQGLRKHVVDGRWPDGVPHLSQDILFKVRPGTNTLAAWRDLIARLKSFRQARNPGTQPNRPGRSRWPEPDAIRRLTGRRARLHTGALSVLDKFPRAAFGLPIVFHFKDHGDPPKTTLEGTESERLASPLILRPVACAANQAVGLALLLEAPHAPPGGLILKDAPNDPSVSASLTPAEAQTIQPLGGQTDVLRAFLTTL